MKKTGRNDPCPCGSGKKFKKCCEAKMIGGRFMATRVDPESAPQIRKTAGLTSLFHSRLAETPKKPMPPQESSQEIPPSEPVSPSEEQKKDDDFSSNS